MTSRAANADAATVRAPTPRSSRRGGIKPISLRDVAREAKVSVATVSMVLNDNPRISRATQMRVQRLIDRMGYQPNRLAQSLSSKYTCVLAVLLPALRHAFADAYFGELISGICDARESLATKSCSNRPSRISSKSESTSKSSSDDISTASSAWGRMIGIITWLTLPRVIIRQ